MTFGVYAYWFIFKFFTWRVSKFIIYELIILICFQLLGLFNTHFHTNTGGGQQRGKHTQTLSSYLLLRSTKHRTLPTSSFNLKGTEQANGSEYQVNGQTVLAGLPPFRNEAVHS